MSVYQILPGERLSYVYFIYNGNDAIKIGVTDDLQKRVASLQTGNAHKIELLDAFWCRNKMDAMNVEKYAHEMFEPFRLNGEWFEAEPVFYWLEKCASKQSVFIGPYEWRVKQ